VPESPPLSRRRHRTEAKVEELCLKSEAGAPSHHRWGVFVQPKRGGTTGGHALVPNPGRARVGLRDALSKWEAKRWHQTADEVGLPLEHTEAPGWARPRDGWDAHQRPGPGQTCRAWTAKAEYPESKSEESKKRIRGGHHDPHAFYPQ